VLLMAEYFGRYRDGGFRSNFAPRKDPYELRGGWVYYQDERMASCEIGVIYDRGQSLLLKHGFAPFVTARYREMRERYRDQSLVMVENLVCMTFDARELGVAWLNQALATSGSITRFIRAIAQEKGIQLPKGAV
jgi:hypothetical protein